MGQRLHYFLNKTLNDRKLRMPHIRDIKGRSRLLRALDNEEDGISSAFLRGKQNGIFLINLYLVYKRVMKSYPNLLRCIIN